MQVFIDAVSDFFVFIDMMKNWTDWRALFTTWSMTKPGDKQDYVTINHPLPIMQHQITGRK